MVNSVLSRKGAKFAVFDLKNFYLNTPLEWPEYAKVKLTDIPQEVIENTTSPSMHTMDGFTSPSTKGFMDYLKQENLPMIYYQND